MQRFHHDCVRTMLRINWHQQWKRKIKMKQLFAELGNRVRPLRWHYETRHLRWVGHIARMKHDRLPLMLLTSWVPHSRPIGCPRMTFGRTVKKALKRREEIWPGLPFEKPDNWNALTDAARHRLRQKHAKEARKHEIKMHTHWMTLAQDRGSWRTMIRGPEPEATQGGPAVHRARAHRSNHATNTTTNQSTSTQRLSRTIISNTPASLTMTRQWRPPTTPRLKPKENG